MVKRTYYEEVNYDKFPSTKISGDLFSEGWRDVGALLMECFNTCSVLCGRGLCWSA